jgi:hypothetical protein
LREPHLKIEIFDRSVVFLPIAKLYIQPSQANNCRQLTQASRSSQTKQSKTQFKTHSEDLAQTKKIVPLLIDSKII